MSGVVAVSRTLFLAALPALPLAVTISAPGGCGSGPLDPSLAAVWYERIPLAPRGQVLGAGTAAASATLPRGPLVGGPLPSIARRRGTAIAVGATSIATARCGRSVRGFAR